MDNLIWKAKQFVRKLVPVTIALALIYGGYRLYREGVFRRGLGPTIARALHHVPYFGSRFRHYHVNESTFAYARHERHHAVSHRRHHGRHHHLRRHHHSRHHHHRR